MAVSVAKQTNINNDIAVNNFPFPSWLIPASTGTAFATIALCITLFWTQPQLKENTQKNNFIEDINLLSQNDDLELYQNLEFYLWLEDETSS